MVQRRIMLAALVVICFGFVAAENDDSEFGARRIELRRLVGESIVLIPTHKTIWGRQRPNPDFLYLTGYEAPSGLLVLSQDPEQPELLIVLNRGRQGADGNLDIPAGDSSDLPRILSRHRETGAKICLPFSGLDLIHDMNLTRVLGGFSQMTNLDEITHEMRTIKSDDEILRLRKSVSITALALRETIRATGPGIMEKDLAAIFTYISQREGADGVSFLQTASGPNAVNVHFNSTERVLEEGDMVVFDVGIHRRFYHGDISRSVPASGRFSPEQKEIYQLVLDAQAAALEVMKPGLSIEASHEAAEDVLMDGLQKLGLVTDVKSEWQRKLFLQHGFYHFIGLEVHDVWNYFRPRLAGRNYKPGMVITMEPGLYFPERMLEDIPARLKGMVEEEEFEKFVTAIMPIYKKYIHIGVRIEDDVLITEDGQEILSSAVPKEIQELEALMAEESALEKLRVD